MPNPPHRPQPPRRKPPPPQLPIPRPLPEPRPIGPVPSSLGIYLFIKNLFNGNPTFNLAYYEYIPKTDLCQVVKNNGFLDRYFDWILYFLSATLVSVSDFK